MKKSHSAFPEDEDMDLLNQLLSKPKDGGRRHSSASNRRDKLDLNSMLGSADLPDADEFDKIVDLNANLLHGKSVEDLAEREMSVAAGVGDLGNERVSFRSCEDLSGGRRSEDAWRAAVPKGGSDALRLDGKTDASSGSGSDVRQPTLGNDLGTASPGETGKGALFLSTFENCCNAFKALH